MIAEIWRYPVKSMAGEQMESCALAPGGMLGDRGWAVRDADSGDIRSASLLPGLFFCSARYIEEPVAQQTAHVEVTLPDGSQLCTTNLHHTNDRLSAYLGSEVILSPLHEVDGGTGHGQIRPIDQLCEPERAGSSTRFEPLRGTFFDVATLHILTTSSIAMLGSLNPLAKLDVRRFRPNLLVRTPDDATGFIEQQWLGSTLRIGKVELSADNPVPRCGMTTIAQPGLPKDPTILRTIVQQADRNLGIYCSTSMYGDVCAGDRIRLLPNTAGTSHRNA